MKQCVYNCHAGVHRLGSVACKSNIVFVLTALLAPLSSLKGPRGRLRLPTLLGTKGRSHFQVVLAIPDLTSVGHSHTQFKVPLPQLRPISRFSHCGLVLSLYCVALTFGATSGMEGGWEGRHKARTVGLPGAARMCHRGPLTAEPYFLSGLFLTVDFQ